MTRRITAGPQSVLSDRSRRTTGADARTMNLTAGRAVADAVRTTLGPRGMDKMLVDGSGTVVVTNDGVTLLEEMAITHPAAKLVVEVATTQESSVGDGTTSAVVLTGALLSAAEELIERGVHPSTIVSGYRRAATIAQERLSALAIEIEPDDRETLEQIAATAMTGKGSEPARDVLSTLVVDAVAAAVRDDGTVDRDGIYVRSFRGGSLGDSWAVDGTVVGQRPPHPDMPTSFTDAAVLVYEGAIEATELGVDVEATLTDREGIDAFADRERAELDALVDALVDTGADVVLVDGGIDDRAQSRFADAGVLALRRVNDDNRRRVAAATGATRVGTIDALDPSVLGTAGRVRREMIRGYSHPGNARPERVFVFEEGAGGDVGTLVLRGGTEHVVEEVERSVEDAVDVVTSAIEDGAVVAGAGAIEVELALAVREAAGAVEGREQLAVEAFADAIEVGPRAIAENAGFDAIDVLVDLIARHDAGERTAGIDVDTGGSVDALAAGVVEPLRVKESAVDAAVDAATALLRIDAVVAAGEFTAADGDDEDDRR